MIIEILSCSARQNSVSRASIPDLRAAFASLGNHEVMVTDVRDLPPIWVTTTTVTAYPAEYQDLHRRVSAADGVIFLVPIHCYTACAPAKSISEILSTAMLWKPVGFVVGCGTHRSHLAISDLMISMIFDQQACCYPKPVHITRADIDDAGAVSHEIQERLVEFAKGFASFAGALRDLRRN
ncbi:NADPH-dependent FMN reductase [Inquilinus sp. Marseille-Q2685]|uniref:NADPH-dependent FMN reductase n=1 Tax=Inquilinus sp. Marseille-Q2685 TaxID=2866581 RepID=UPI001CE400EF|nr:NAD(P)H-dependent oxidoreductase [Inquilinus sp. Marseille-Q2685]